MTKASLPETGASVLCFVDDGSDDPDDDEDDGDWYRDEDGEHCGLLEKMRPMLWGRRYGLSGERVGTPAHVHPDMCMLRP